MLKVSSFLWSEQKSTRRYDLHSSLKLPKARIQLETEAPAVLDHRPGSAWPPSGAIRFIDYETKYRSELEPVLRRINIDIRSGEKVGIVGRTGAGKSSMTLALFRLVESTHGRIVIDSEDIAEIGLEDLRLRLTIIPQV